MITILKYLLFAIVLLLNTSIVYGQKIDFKKPPRQENTYLFKVLRYNRQPTPPKYMLNRIQQILEIPTNNWTAQDSLYYAYENVHLKKFELALSIFARLEIDTIQDPHAQTLYRTALQHSNRYEMLEKFNEKTIPGNPAAFYSIKDAIMDLNTAYLKQKQKIFIPDSTLIFPILKSNKLNEFNPDRSPNNNKLVQIAFAIDSAFRHFTILHDRKDYILSQAFEEMGDFQEKYFYATNAFFYYSASIYYYKTDAAVAKKYNNVVDEMNKKNFLSISFKNKFGKVIN